MRRRTQLATSSQLTLSDLERDQPSSLASALTAQFCRCERPAPFKCPDPNDWPIQCGKCGKPCKPWRAS